VTDRELDEAVAVKVMGWEVSPVIEGSPYHGGSYVRHGPMWHRLFNPSTDIAEAWKVVERMQQDGYTLHMRSGKVTGAAFYRVGSDVHGPVLPHPTAPRAICEAALAALGPA
jgi:hypothetical protein